MRIREWPLPQGQAATLLHQYKPHPNPILLGLQEALALTLILTYSGTRGSIALTHPSPHTFFIEDISWRLHDVPLDPKPAPIDKLQSTVNY